MRYLYEYDKIILETDAAGNETAHNVNGTNLISRTMAGARMDYLYNGHTDVTALIDNSRTIQASYYYDAFGNIVEKTGSFNNNITYSGYQFDDETGLYYYNARFYDSKIARFLSEDTYSGNPSDPLSLNLYNYVSNNPIKYIDPTGHWQQGDENLTYEARVEISRLTDLYYSATAQAEKDVIHATADAIRTPANVATTTQTSVTGQNANNILSTTSNKDSNGNAYMTATQWNSFSTTKTDAVIVSAVKDDKITQAEVKAVAESLPTAEVKPVVSKTTTSVNQEATPVTPVTPDKPVSVAPAASAVSQGTGSSTVTKIDTSYLDLIFVDNSRKVFL